MCSWHVFDTNTILMGTSFPVDDRELFQNVTVFETVRTKNNTDDCYDVFVCEWVLFSREENDFHLRKPLAYWLDPALEPTQTYYIFVEGRAGLTTPTFGITYPGHTKGHDQTGHDKLDTKAEPTIRTRVCCIGQGYGKLIGKWKHTNNFFFYFLLLLGRIPP